jgi:AraC-like DNA-binding protein
MSTILEATTVKQLGIGQKDKTAIKRNFNNGLSVKKNSLDTGISRRKVMRTLEIEGLTYFSKGSYT